MLTITLFAVIGVVLLVITFFSAKERITPPPGQKNSVKQDFKDIVSNRPWKAMFILTLFLFTTLAMWGSSMSYYFNYVVDKTALFDFLQNFGLVRVEDMKDYHVFSMDDVMNGEITDHGVVLSVEDIPWSGRQLWDCDVVLKAGKYYMYFPLKDQNDIFRIGVAVSDRPYGPFIPEANPMKGSYSIDPAVFTDDDGKHYMYFGGLWGGQLQRYRDNKALESAAFPADHETAIPARVACLSDDLMEFAEAPRAVILLDENGLPITAGDTDRRFFEASWMHKYNGTYYFSYSTGDTHRLCYAIGDNPYGPFTYQGVILTPVVGWTTHHAIVEYRGKWYLFHHDSAPSGGRTWLRSLKVCELRYDADGRIETIDGGDCPMTGQIAE